jgi:hypothetical protein
MAASRQSEFPLVAHLRPFAGPQPYRLVLLGSQPLIASGIGAGLRTQLPHFPGAGRQCDVGAGASLPAAFRKAPRTFGPLHTYRC